MKLRSLTTRAAIAGATTALMAGGLVAATGTAANAVDDTTGYTCTTPIGAETWDLTISTPVIPATATAGQSFPGGLLSLTATLQIPSPTGAALASYGVDHADANDYAVGIGSSSIGAPIAFDEVVVNEDGSATANGAAANEPFSLPKAGTYKAQLPSDFTLETEVDLGAGPVPVSIPCTSDAPGDLGSVEVTKGESATAAKAGKKHKVTVTVDRPLDDVTPAGKVTTKIGKKSYTETLKKGKATFTFPKSAKGKKVVFTYKGDGYTAGSNSPKTTIK